MLELSVVNDISVSGVPDSCFATVQPVDGSRQGVVLQYGGVGRRLQARRKTNPVNEMLHRT